MGRARERDRRIVLSALASVGVKLVALASTVLTVPLTLDYLGTERYGLWTAVMSFIAFFSVADLGVGFGLVNALATAEGKNDREGGRRAVSSAFVMLIAVACVIGFVFAVAWPMVSWGAFLNASPATADEANQAVAVLAACFFIGLPLSVVAHTYTALQEAYRNSVYQITGGLVSLVAILVAVRSEASIPWLVLASSLGPLLGNIIGGWRLFAKLRPDLRPAFRDAARSPTWMLARLATYYFIIQVSAGVAYQSDSLVLARTMGPEAVATYGVTQKLFMQVPLLLGFLFAPLWPAYADAAARGDVGWIRRTLRRTIALSLAVNVSVAFVLYFAAPALLSLWVGNDIQAPSALRACFALWIGVNSLSGPLSMFINGVGALRYEAMVGAVMAIFNIGISIVFTWYWGIVGVLLGSIVTKLLISYPTVAVIVPRVLRELERRVSHLAEPSDAARLAR